MNESVGLALIGSLLVFVLVAYLTRATRRRVAAALIGAYVVISIVAVWDMLAGALGWWRYPESPTGYGPLTGYVTDALWPWASGALIGWRMIRRRGASGWLGFLTAFALYGVATDYILQATTGLIVLGPGLTPWIGDALVTYAASGALLQLVMRPIAGAAHADRLAPARLGRLRNPVPWVLIRLACHELWSHKGRTLLSAAGIGLGVVLIVAVSLVGRSTTRAFSDMLDDVAGEAVLEVTAGDTGFAEEVLDVVRAQAGVKHAAPLLLGSLFVDDEIGTPLALIGVDVTEENHVRTYKGQVSNDRDEVVDDPLAFLNSPGAVLLTKAFVAQSGRKIGDAVLVLTPTGKQQLTIRGALRPQGVARALGDSLAVMDLFAAQHVLGRDRKLDRISITVKDGDAVDDVAQALRQVLPAGLTVQRPAQRGAAMETLLASFQYTLSAVSLLALLVGVCVVYNAMCTTVARRQRDLGVLRALGSRQRDIRRLVLIEAAFLGVAGTVVGWIVGVWMARFLIGPVAEAAEAQAAAALNSPSLIAPGASELIKACAGIVAALIAAWIPARQASRVSVLETLRAGLFERMASGVQPRRLRISATLLIVAAALVGLGAQLRSALLIGAGTLLLVIAFLLLAAFGAAILATRSEPLLAALFGVRGSLVAASLARNPERTAFTASVLAVGVVLHIFIVTVHNSVRQNFLREQEHTTQADFIVFPTFVTGGRITAPVDGRVADSLRAVAGVADAVADRDLEQDFRGTRVSLQAYDAAYFTNPRYGRWLFTDGDPDTALHTLVTDDAVLVSHNFAFRFQVHPGDLISFDAPAGQATFRVAGIIVESFHNVGTVVMRRELYRRWWQDPLTNWLYVLLAPGADPEAVKAGILRSVRGEYRLRVLSGREFLRHVEDSVDAAFRFTRLLEAVVLLVVLLSLADTLVVSVLTRVREIATVRALGAYRRDVALMIGMEGAVITALATAIGIAGGVAFAVLWMRVQFKYLFGWIMAAYVPPLAIATAVGLVALVTVAAAAYPAWWASRRVIARALVAE